MTQKKEENTPRQSARNTQGNSTALRLTLASVKTSLLSLSQICLENK